MRKLAFLLVLITLAFAQTEFEKGFETQTTQGGLMDIFKDWRVVSILAIMVSIVLIGIAYMIGISMDTPEMKAWAGNELVQVFATVIIVIALMAMIALLDVVALAMVQTSGLTISCSGGQSCLGNVSDAYLQSYIDTAKADAKGVAIDAIEKAGLANRRFGAYCSSILCGQIGFSSSLLGHYLLDQDRLGIVFEYYSNLIASLEAQKFFVTKISFAIGPLLLAAGIVGRSFFFTRKIGGLLIATAAGIMFFLPGMYVFDWVTLDTTLTGDKSNVDSAGTVCPEECKTPHPLAVVENGSAYGHMLGSPKEVYDAFPNESSAAIAILNGAVSSQTPGHGNFSGKSIISCMVVTDQQCPLSCRELPYPTSINQCMNLTAGIPKNCAKLPDKCWLRRLVTSEQPKNPDEKPLLSTCPQVCKVVPPLNGNCDIGKCLESRPDCRVFKRIDDTGDISKDFIWTPKPIKGAGNDQFIRCMLAVSCLPDYDAMKSCSYVVPETGSCTKLCDGCPEICRIETNDTSKIPSICYDSLHELKSGCKDCPPGCKVNTTHIGEVQTDACIGCDKELRIVTYSQGMNATYTTGACDIQTKCTAEDRVPIPRSSCEQCLFSEESQMYEPPIQAGCTELCRPSDNLPQKSASAYTGIGQEGLVGTSEIRNVSKLMLPAYVLPLLNIAATLVFIRGLSGILGGDIEIPGISKVF